MSYNWVEDIAEIHDKYGFHEKVSKMDPAKLKALLEFRSKFINEESHELEEAINKGDMNEVVDALIDICVVAIGTLDLFRVYSHEAWSEVHTRNMQKEVGIKESRPNPLGLPDLVKPEGWEAPCHKNNLGLLKKIANG